MQTRLRPITREKSGLGAREWKLLKSLRTPSQIQDFINKIPFNFEKSGETIMSVERTVKARKAHCLEGALVASLSLWIQGRRPLLLVLSAPYPDFDHVVALFQEEGKWGAISKTNHSVLRYREPVYRDVRELAMSYFHEYFLNDGSKSMRAYREPLDLSKTSINWIIGREELYDLDRELSRTRHNQILGKKQVRKLRKADKIERKASKMVVE